MDQLRAASPALTLSYRLPAIKHISVAASCIQIEHNDRLFLSPGFHVGRLQMHLVFTGIFPYLPVGDLSADEAYVRCREQLGFYTYFVNPVAKDISLE